MADALGCAPTAALETPLDERVNRWIEEEPAWASPLDAIDTLASLEPAPDVRLVEQWKAQSLSDLGGLVASVLTEYFDRLQATCVALRLSKPNSLAPLVADSLKPERLALSALAWLEAGV